MWQLHVLATFVPLERVFDTFCGFRAIILCLYVLPHVYCFYYVCVAVLHTLVGGLLARSQYPEGPATGHLSTGFSWFPSV